MPRKARASVGGIVYHVLNRGNNRATVFHDQNDYGRFIEFMSEAHKLLPMRVLAYCLMPNHFHMVLWPTNDGDLGRWMQHLMTKHVRWHHKKYGSSGHLWQERFKDFEVQSDSHLLTVLRYVERNPVRASLAQRAEDWKWSSARVFRTSEPPPWLVEPPCERPDNWLDWVNQPQTDTELESLRKSLNGNLPWGDEKWVAQFRPFRWAWAEEE